MLTYANQFIKVTPKERLKNGIEFWIKKLKKDKHCRLNQELS